MSRLTNLGVIQFLIDNLLTDNEKETLGLELTKHKPIMNKLKINGDYMRLKDAGILISNCDISYVRDEPLHVHGRVQWRDNNV